MEHDRYRSNSRPRPRVCTATTQNFPQLLSLFQFVGLIHLRFVLTDRFHSDYKTSLQNHIRSPLHPRSTKLLAPDAPPPTKNRFSNLQRI
jgi:hypothetical protein